MTILGIINERPEIWSIANAMRTWDEELFRHSIAVADLAATVSRELDISKKQIPIILMGGFLHDFGKTSWPKFLISKKQLSAYERQIIRVHPLYGTAYAQENIGTLDPLVCRIIEEHHERPDGTGYPRGLTKDDIHPWSRIVSSVECFVALTEYREYRETAYSPDEAIEIALHEGHDKTVLAIIRRLIGKRKVARAVEY